MPYGAKGLARLDGPCAFRLQGGTIVRKQPSLAVIIAAVRAPADVDVAVGQQQAWPIDLVQVCKCGCDPVQSVLCGYCSGPPELFLPSGDVKCMQSMDYVAVLVRFSDKIKRTARRIDHWRRDDANLAPSYSGFFFHTLYNFVAIPGIAHGRSSAGPISYYVKNFHQFAVAAHSCNKALYFRFTYFSM